MTIDNGTSTSRFFVRNNEGLGIGTSNPDAGLIKGTTHGEMVKVDFRVPALQCSGTQLNFFVLLRVFGMPHLLSLAKRWQVRVSDGL